MKTEEKDINPDNEMTKRNPLEKIDIIGYLFAAFSVIAGPVLFIASIRHPSGLDCTDGSWDPNITLAERSKIYADNFAQVHTVSRFFLLVTIILLSLLIFQMYKSSKLTLLIPIFLLGFMLLGYLFLSFWEMVPNCT